MEDSNQKPFGASPWSIIFAPIIMLALGAGLPLLMLAIAGPLFVLAPLLAFVAGPVLSG
jgi:hypothetical protein